MPIADLATPIPGGTGLFTGFTALALAAIPGNPVRVAFLGTGADQQGVYLSELDTAGGNGPPIRVADLATPIPGGTGTFTAFSAVSASAEHTAFLGLGSLGQKGIYLASALTKVIAVGDTLSGKTVTDLRFGTQGLDGIRLAFTAHFADGTEGVFTVQVASYPFAGFFAPVDNPPVLNKAKAGTAIPVRFSLSGNQGLDIFSAGFPASRRIVCSTTSPIDAVERTVSATASGLAYNPRTDRYIYAWKTKQSWVKTCRQLVVKLKDDTFHRANFAFK